MSFIIEMFDHKLAQAFLRIGQIRHIGGNSYEVFKQDLRINNYVVVLIRHTGLYIILDQNGVTTKYLPFAVSYTIPWQIYNSHLLELHASGIAHRFDVKTAQIIESYRPRKHRM